MFSPTAQVMAIAVNITHTLRVAGLEASRMPKAIEHLNINREVNIIYGLGD